MLEWSTITGWLPAVLTLIGLLALLGMIVLPPRPAWWKRALLLVAITGLGVLALNLVVTKLWQPFPDTLPASVLVWAWLGLSGIVLALALILPSWRRWTTILTAVIGAVALVTIAGVQINRCYGQYPTLGTALGLTRPHITDLPETNPDSGAVSAPPGGFLADVWQPATALSTRGTVSQVNFSADESGFRARPGFVYLPPAYYAQPRPLLPVLVLLSGQPGSPDHWLISGQLTKVMDAYAQVHQGLAPVVVLADHLGSNFANPMCVDSPHGNVETYLARDVPNWIRDHLQTAPDRGQWAIAGLSNGGTCSLQLATRAPEVYGRFLDISGEYEPLDGSKTQTVNKYFGGDMAAYEAASPVEIMKKRQFTQTAGRIVVGTGDGTYYPQLQQVLNACQAAGMSMSWLELPGGHSWQVWAPALAQSLDWLSANTSLARS